ERPAGTPEAIKAWFYPGENYGHDFVYPKQKPAILAQADPAPVPPALAVIATNEEPQVIAEQAPLPPPAETEPQITEVIEVAQADVVLESPAEPSLPTELPRTASHLPLIGILGLFSLGAALSMRLVRG